jgi:hypothetical protein
MSKRLSGRRRYMKNRNVPVFAAPRQIGFVICRSQPRIHHPRLPSPEGNGSPHPNHATLHCRFLPRPKCLLSSSSNPVGVEASVTKYVAQVQKVVQSSGLKSHMHSYGTTIGTRLHTMLTCRRTMGSRWLCVMS